MLRNVSANTSKLLADESGQYLLENALLGSLVAFLVIAFVEQAAQAMVDVYCNGIAEGTAYWPW